MSPEIIYGEDHPNKMPPLRIKVCPNIVFVSVLFAGSLGLICYKLEM
jgi:hypothetical protein